MDKNFPDGYEVAKKSDVRYRKRTKAPAATIQRSGTLTLNTTAMAFLLRPGEKEEASIPAYIGYNPELRKIAIRRSSVRGDFPEIVSITRTGEFKNLGVFSLKWYASHFGIPITGRRHPVQFEAGVLYVNLAATI